MLTSKRNTRALSSLQVLSTIVVLALLLLTFAYLGSTEVNSSQIADLQNKVSSLEGQIQSGSNNVTLLKGNLTNLNSELSNLPLMHQSPVTRNIKVEWVNSLNSQQDRFFLPTITVNQGDTLDITFISNDTDAHTFTMEAPYDFQINATVPGTFDYLNHGSMFTTNATNNSPGVKISGTPGNVTGTGSFVAKYPGIFEYFCVYHVALGMYGYLIILPNTAPSSTGTTGPSTGHNSTVSIVPGAFNYSSPNNFSPKVISVVMGVNNTVIWTNNDSFPHTVTADDGSFSSGNMDPGNSFVWTFSKPGTYKYHCSYHSWMTGTVIVLTG
jgi:plastocyanin